MSQSSLSHTIRELEARLGVRLLTRTTRSVAPTQAGERLLQTIGPRLEEIDAEVSAKVVRLKDASYLTRAKAPVIATMSAGEAAGRSYCAFI